MIPNRAFAFPYEETQREPSLPRVGDEVHDDVDTRAERTEA